MAGRGSREVDDGSQCANVSRISHDLDEAVGDSKPLAIVSYWSEAPTQGTGYGSSQGETANIR